MPQVSLVGTGGDYTTLAAWESGEAGSDYGVGNPAIAEITGSVARENITGTWVRGFTIRAAAGEEVFSGSGTAIITGTARTIINGSTAGVSIIVQDLETVPWISGGSSATHEFNRLLIDASNTTGIGSGTTDTTVNDTLIINTSRGLEAGSGFEITANNVTIVAGTATPNLLAVRAACTNVFVYAASSTAFFSCSGDYNAGFDTSAPGANSLDNRTTADFADFAGGDYRTASGSALATAGDGVLAAYIGYALETSGATYTLAFDSGTYTLTGQAVGLTAQRSLALNTGSYALTGNDVSLLFNRTLAIDTGSYALTGNDTSLLANRSLALDSGSYTVTGNAVDFVYTPISGPTYTLLMDTGSYFVTGNTAALKANRLITTDTGVYTVTGNAVTLRYGGDVWAIESDATTTWSEQTDKATTWTAATDAATIWNIEN